MRGVKPASIAGLRVRIRLIVAPTIGAQDRKADLDAKTGLCGNAQRPTQLAGKRIRDPRAADRSMIGRGDPVVSHPQFEVINAARL